MPLNVKPAISLPILIGLYLIASTVLSHQTYTQMKVYKNSMTEISQLLNFQKRLLNPQAWLFKDNGQEQMFDDVATSTLICREARKKAHFSALILVFASLVFFAAMFFLFRHDPAFFRVLTLTIVVIALVALFNGLTTPMLEISAFMDDLTIPINLEVLGMSFSKDFLFEGRMMFYYQNKSVLDVIQILFQEKNYVVGVSIVVFSFLVPFIKLGATLLMVVFKRPEAQSFAVKFVGAIGKWSMADVFVAASFLSYLGFSNMNTGVQTESHTLLGLYFFFTYVLLSIVSGYACKAALQQAQQGNI